MAKKFTLFFLLLLGGLAANAQSFQASLIGGFSACQLIGTDIWGFTKPGLIGGASAQLEWGSGLYTKLELYYIQKGSRKVWENEDGGSEVFNLNINYAQVPILGGFRFREKFSGEFGFYGAAYLSHRLRDEGGNFPNEDPANRPFNPYDFGGLIGLGYAFSDAFNINIRYTQSILAVRSHRFGQTFLLNRGEYNSVIEITGRFNLGTGKKKSE